MTQLESARKGLVTPEIRAAAASENAAAGILLKELAAGRAVLPANINHKSLAPAVIGRAFRCKINVNLGASDLESGLKTEICKLKLSMDLKADAVMDLSTGADIKKIRREIIRLSSLPVGTVPIYETLKRAGDIKKITPELLLEVIEEQAQEGVDFMTIHAGLLRKYIPLAKNRVTGIVSRGGSIMAKWMEHYGRENPLYDRFEDICAIFRKYDVTFSLGDALRPGSLADACDKAQFSELKTLGELVLKSRRHGVQVMVEGPGHVPLDKVLMNMKKADKYCHGAPFYVLGPLVTDIAAGYDHINAAIGGALAAWGGASFLCYVTPKEHLGLPGPEDVRQGIVASRIAAHAGDIARGLPGARDADDAMSRARYSFDWEKQFAVALDGKTAERMHRESLPDRNRSDKDYCSMCGPEFCSMRNSKTLNKPVGAGK